MCIHLTIKYSYKYSHYIFAYYISWYMFIMIIVIVNMEHLICASQIFVYFFLILWTMMWGRHYHTYFTNGSSEISEIRSLAEFYTAIRQNSWLPFAHLHISYAAQPPCFMTCFKLKTMSPFLPDHSVGFLIHRTFSH